jgi:regulation of enolase protein 1 (concanavalin A-like superfamily)
LLGAQRQALQGLRMITRFDSTVLDPRLRWFCAPPTARLEAERGRLIVEPAAGTDFWQRTHYGFRADNGHFLHATAQGSFVLGTRVSCSPVHQYDQAGLMVRVSADCWLKTSIEHEPDEPFDRLGAVVTNHGYSDWSTQPVPKHATTVSFRIRAEPTALIVEASFDGLEWQQLRVAHLAERTLDGSLQAGLYCCSPKAAGFRAEFHELELR